jgi:hypothetical protein
MSQSYRQNYCKDFLMVSPFRFVVLTLVLLATLFGVGIMHGRWTQRWTPTAAQHILDMENIPLVIGMWEGKPIEEKVVQQVLGGGNQFLLRRYVNQYNGTVATTMLTCGPPGPMLIQHLPTECYVSAGYEQVGQTKRFVSQSPDSKVPDEFWVGTVKRTTDAFPVIVRVYWSWTAIGGWQTPDRPRFTFAPYPMVYRIYVIQSLADENEQFEGALVHEFIKELTTAMRESVFVSSSR